MTVTELLQEKFRATKFETVTDWMSETKIDLSLQACTAVLLRGKNAGIVTTMFLASALGCTAEEMKWIAKQKGDDTLWRLITKDSISREDRKLIDDYHRLNNVQKDIVNATIGQFLKEANNESR